MGVRPKVAVIGLGITGASVAAYLARAGYKVTGYDQFHSSHGYGSSHGENRLFRRVPAEGDVYVRMAALAAQGWLDLEAASGTRLFFQNGCLDINEDDNDWARRAHDLAKAHGVASQMLTCEQAAEILPVFDFKPGMDICLTPGSGILLAEDSIAALLDLARRNGAIFRHSYKIREIDAGKKQITADDGAHENFDFIIICAGSWAQELIPHLPLVIEKSTLGWYGGKVDMNACPGFSFKGNDGSGFYGMPGLDGKSYKIGHARQYNRIEASDHAPEVTDQDQQILDTGIGNYFTNLSLENSRFAGCKITHAPDGDFIFDRHPENPDVMIFSPCSGHGFKYAPVYGQIAGAMITEKELRLPFDLAAFSLKRFG